MIEIVILPVKKCTCNLCEHLWHTLADRPPSVCPTCRSREWDGVKVKRKPARGPAVELPKPVKVRSNDDDTVF